VQLKAAREDPHSGDREVTTESRFVFVAIDESGSPIPVPDLTAENERCRELREQALAWEREDE
jgi:acyl-CoA hydrolase